MPIGRLRSEKKRGIWHRHWILLSHLLQILVYMVLDSASSIRTTPLQPLSRSRPEWKKTTWTTISLAGASFHLASNITKNQVKQLNLSGSKPIEEDTKRNKLTIFFLTETLDEDGETGACDDVGGAGTLGLTGEVEACRYICSPATELPETQHSWDLFVEAENKAE